MKKQKNDKKFYSKETGKPNAPWVEISEEDIRKILRGYWGDIDMAIRDIITFGAKPVIGIPFTIFCYK